MKILYAPWRSDYSADAHKERQGECIFCVAAQAQDDAQQLILFRSTHCYVMLNRHPYNAGHLLIVPYEHKAKLDACERATRIELIELVSHSITVLETVLKCEGINVGLNLGKPSGGSIPDHLHMHVIPRWIGDTNFLVPTAETKVISFDLRKMYEQLRSAFARDA